MSFSASLSGLFANQEKLNVIGNNLANINTLAFKSSRVEFADLVNLSVGGPGANPMQIGLGVTIASISPTFTQGGIETTGVPTNVAIQGNGFFLTGPASDRTYTRAGDFSFDADGMLVTTTGEPVQGYTAIDPLTGTISATGQPGNIIVPPGVLRPPTTTTSFATLSNLDVDAVVGDTAAVSVQMYDALGASHAATVTYTNVSAGQWAYRITVPGADLATGVVGTPAQIAAGTVGFGATGALTTVNGAAAADVTIAAPAWRNGATPTAITWDLVDANAVGALTGYASPSATSSVTQNGTGPGTVSGLTINGVGEILATFGAGKTVAVGQLSIANFNNPQGLVKLGNNGFGESSASGLPNVGIAGTGGRGGLIGGSLEQSNVDVAQEFTQMILAQRGYQANGKSITTADEVLQDTLNLKR
jgi:flagellar hook protein FlgE